MKTIPFNKNVAYLDLLFLNRNKNYGSYTLRKHYSKRALKALLVTLFIASCFFLVAWLSKEKVAAMPEVIRHDKVIDVKILDIEQPVKIPIVEETVVPKGMEAKVEKYVIPDIVKDNTLIEEADRLKSQDELNKAQIGAKSQDGIETGDISVPVGKDDGDVHIIEAIKPANEIKQAYEIDQSPEFDGNLSKFLGDNLEYPEIAKKMGQSGKVVVAFVVSEDGSITNVSVTKSVAAALDEEAVRVVKKMPRWKPGKLNGKPVKTYFKLPVNFKIEA